MASHFFFWRAGLGRWAGVTRRKCGYSGDDRALTDRGPRGESAAIRVCARRRFDLADKLSTNSVIFTGGRDHFRFRANRGSTINSILGGNTSSSRVARGLLLVTNNVTESGKRISLEIRRSSAKWRTGQKQNRSSAVAVTHSGVDSDGTGKERIGFLGPSLTPARRPRRHGCGDADGGVDLTGKGPPRVSAFSAWAWRFRPCHSAV